MEFNNQKITKVLAIYEYKYKRLYSIQIFNNDKRIAIIGWFEFNQLLKLECINKELSTYCNRINEPDLKELKSELKNKHIQFEYDDCMDVS